MKNILRKYSESALFALAFVLLGIIIVYFAWGIGEVVGQVGRGLNGAGPSTPSAGFNFKTAKTLDLRGLVNQTP